MHSYNTQRSPLLLKEYGRNIQKLVAYVGTFEDKNTRTKYAHNLLKLMGAINATVERSQKRWDDLFIMSGYTLDIENVMPLPAKNALAKKKANINYVTKPITFRCYGRNIEYLIKKAAMIQCPKEQEHMVLHIARLMRTLNYLWNNKNIGIDVVLENMQRIAERRLSVDFEKIKANSIFYTNHKEKSRIPQVTSSTFKAKKSKRG